MPRRRLTVGATAGATEVGAVEVEISREDVEELHDGTGRGGRRGKRDESVDSTNVQTRRECERDGTSCVQLSEHKDVEENEFWVRQAEPGERPCWDVQGPVLQQLYCSSQGTWRVLEKIELCIY